MVTFAPPAVARSSEPARWLTSRLDFFTKPWVTGTVGPDFDSYARIFHPPGHEPGAPRWSRIARNHGRTMHAGAQWDRINRPLLPATDGADEPGDPRAGNLETETLAALCSILTGHTRTPAQCWFAVWDGWGWQHSGGFVALRSTESGEPLPPVRSAPQTWQLDLTGPTFTLPGRRYHLFGGPVQAATDIGTWPTAEWFIPQSPSIFFPQDHSWCVSTEVDADSTLVGGSDLLIADIVSSPMLEALPIAPDEPRQDTLNPW